MFTVGGLILVGPAFFAGLPLPAASAGSDDGAGADMTGITSCDGAGGGGGDGVAGSGDSAPALGVASTEGDTGRWALYRRRLLPLRR